MKLKWILPLFVSSVAVFAENVLFDRTGTLRFGEHKLEFVVFTPKWRGYRQGGPERRFFHPVELNQERAKIELRLPDCPPGISLGELAKLDERNWRYSFRASFDSETPLRSGVLDLQLPADEWRGRTIVAGGREILLPVKPDAEKKPRLFSGYCKDLRLTDRTGTWALSGGLQILIQDNRCYKNGSTFEIRISLVRETEKPFPAGATIRLRRETPESTPLDLSAAMNMSLRDDVPNDGKGGWTDQGPDNDLRMLKPGTRLFNGVRFTVGEGEKSCIMLRGRRRPDFPAKAETEIAGNVRGRRLYLLHSLAWQSGGAELGTVTVTYRDGSSDRFDLRNGRDAGNWWQPSDVPNGDVVWTGENRSSFVGLYRSQFPLQQKPLARIAFESAGNAIWGIVAASVSDFAAPRIASVPHYVVPGKEWKVLNFIKDPVAGGALDFSFRMDAPAGKYGPVVVRNGRFEFRDRPGVPARFYGTNICSQAPFVSKEWADRLADRLARHGFNAVRIHHHDSLIADPHDSTKLNPERMEQLDYFISALARRGIYWQTDLFVSRRIPAGELKGIDRRLTDFDVYKALFFLRDDVFENFRVAAANFLNHVNPYTKFAVKDDPALISLGLVNEDNIFPKHQCNDACRKLYRKAFEAELAKSGRVFPAGAERNLAYEEFLTRLYNRRYAQMKEFVRGLGCEKPLSDQNMGVGPKLAQMRMMYDFVENHHYYNHPEFAGKAWELPVLSQNASAISRFAESPARLFPSRLLGKPFMVTEYDTGRPNPFRAEAAVLFGAYGALQRWDGLFQFAYTHGTEKYQYGRRTDGFFDLATDPVKLCSHALGAALFFDGGFDSMPGPEFRFAVEEKKQIPFEELFPAEYERFGLLGPVGGFAASGNGVKGELLSSSRPVLRKRLAVLAPDGTFRSAGGALELTPARGTLRAVTPKVEAFVLPAGSRGSGKFLRVENRKGHGVFGAFSLDGKPLAESGRVLLMHLTDSAASRMRFSAKDCRKMESWGVPPFLAARGEADIELNVDPEEKYRLFAVDMAGKRLNEIPLVRKGGSLAAKLNVFQPSGAVFSYELIKQEHSGNILRK